MITMNDNFDVKAPKPTDHRYGPYATTAAAIAGVASVNRYIGLTVGVITAGVVEDYWWNDGTADGDLVVKTTGGGSGGIADSVDNLNSSEPLYQWTGTQSQYDQLGTWDSNTFYNITDAIIDIEGFLPLTGGTMTGPISWAENGQTATIDVVVDPLSSTGDVFVFESDAGVRVGGPYIVLDTTNLQMTMPGAIQNAAITVAGINSFGVVSLGYTALPPPAYSVLDTTSTPIVIKEAGAVPVTPWVSLGLSVVLGQDLPSGTGNIQFEGIFSNPTTRSGTVEFGLRIDGGVVNAREIVTQISPNFNQTIAMTLPLQTAYLDGQTLELMARVTQNDNNAFSLDMANSATDLGAMRVFSISGGTGGGTGSVNSVGAVAPVVSSGGTDPQISMPAATGSQSGYLSAANFTLFNNKQNPATTLAGYGITDAYTKSQVDTSLASKANTATSLAGYNIADAYTKTATDTLLAGKADDATTLAGYGITNAYTKAESDSFYPTKAGSGASGTWGISITGNSNFASTASIAQYANAVEDLNNGAADVKQWIGTQAEYDALGSWDAYTFYSITDAETPSTPGDGGTVAWDDVTGKPATYPPSAHTHTTAQVTGLDTALAAKAPLVSPYFTGTPTAVTASVGNDSTQLATTAFVNAEIANDAPSKTGTGASGTWGISVTGNAATATAVNDNGAGTSMKFWYGTESEYTAIGTKDPSTIYLRSA